MTLINNSTANGIIIFLSINIIFTMRNGARSTSLHSQVIRNIKYKTKFHVENPATSTLINKIIAHTINIASKKAEICKLHAN